MTSDCHLPSESSEVRVNSRFSMEESGMRSSTGQEANNKRKRSNDEDDPCHDPGEGPSTSKKVNLTSDPDNEVKESQRSSPNKKDVSKFRALEEQGNNFLF